MKNRKKSPKTSPMDPTHNRLLETLNQVWLAGLGAVSRSHTEGPKLLNELAKAGARIQARTRDAAETAVSGVLHHVQTRVHHALNRLSPARILKEVQALSDNYDLKGKS